MFICNILSIIFAVITIINSKSGFDNAYNKTRKKLFVALIILSILLIILNLFLLVIGFL